MPTDALTGPSCAPTMTAEKKEAVREYLGKVGPDLRKRYGKRSSYSPEQVRRSVEGQGLGIDYVCFAYCMYCSPADFDLVHSATGEVCDCVAMRSLVGDTFFAGSPTFDALGFADFILAGSTAVDAVGGLTDAASGIADVAGGVADAASGVGGVAGGLFDAIGGIFN